MQFTNHQILVIGGTSCVGLASARALADAGANVILTGTRAEAAAAAGSALSRPGRGLALDLADLAGIARLAESLPSLDAVVITAGVTHFAPTEFDTPEAFADVLRINLTGTFLAVRALAPKVRDGGAIVLTTTVLARDYFFGATALSASRAGLEVAVRTFAVELAPRAIRVNAVSLGPIETPAWEKVGATEADRESVRARVPLGRLGQAEEVAEAVLFLASARASFITGHALAVDGGWSAA
jgi:NAD(P)-dependent dehydrogenase (short-subunit alcohol dehydrogenase family)